MVKRSGGAGALRRGWLIGVVMIAGLWGCAGQAPQVDEGAAAAQELSPDEAEAVRAVMRERASRLARLWARATVEVRFRDEQGRRRWEQGDGHFQFVGPSRFALSVGKFGEDVLSLGCDAETLWVFDRGKNSSVSLCRHVNVGRECARALALPASPGVILLALGLTELDAERVTAASGGREAILAAHAGGGEETALAVTVDRTTGEPRSALLRGRGGALIEFRMEQYETIEIVGPRFVAARVPTRVMIRDANTGDELRLFLSDATNGRAEQLPDEAFDLGFLIEAYAPGRVVVLDLECETPARAPVAGSAEAPTGR